MTVWIVAVVMSLVAAAAIVLPLLRRRAQAADPAAYDIEVYKDQLEQVGQDYDRGLLTADQAQAAKTEISRRLLNADSRRQSPGAKMGVASGVSYAIVGLVALAVPAGALGLYAVRGAPDVAGRPYAERASERAQAAGERQPQSLDAAAATLAQRLAKKPDDLRGWLLLARTYMSMQRYPAAVSAYEKALGLDAGNADITSGYGEALFLAAGEVVTPASRSAFEETLKHNPKDPRARYYLALADFEAGDRKKALDGWTSLVGDSPADAPWLPAVRARAGEAAKALGIDVASVMPKPQPPRGEPEQTEAPAGGPSREDAAAMAALSPKERAERIKGMVDGLAAKLEENPRDFQGWMRLIRSYAVLKQKDKARAALAKAREVFKAAPFPLQRLGSLAGELGLEEGSQPRGPTRAQMDAAKDMSPEDRQAMIEGMVAQLASRLKETPGDVQGWIRLARAYTVLKQNDKAKDALARALKGNPENVDLLILYGRTIRSMNGDRSTPESVAAMRKVLTLKPDNIEALWFVGGAEAAAGQTDKAKELWQKALVLLPPGAPERAQLRKQIDALD